MEWWPINRAGGHIFNIFSLNWVIKLPFSAESATTFNLLFLVCMIANWDDPSRAGEQNQYFFTKYYLKQKPNAKQIQSPKHCNAQLMKYCERWQEIYLSWTAMWILNYMLIHWSKIQIWEDWKCYRTHTCKDRCLLQIRLLKVSLIPGFYTSLISPEFICCYPREKTQKNATAMDKKLCMQVFGMCILCVNHFGTSTSPHPLTQTLAIYQLLHLPITESCAASLSLRTTDVSFRSSSSLSGDKLGETSAIRRLSLSEWGIWPVLGLGVEFEPQVTS